MHNSVSEEDIFLFYKYIHANYLESEINDLLLPLHTLLQLILENKNALAFIEVPKGAAILIQNTKLTHSSHLWFVLLTLWVGIYIPQEHNFAWGENPLPFDLNKIIT